MNDFDLTPILFRLSTYFLPFKISDEFQLNKFNDTKKWNGDLYF
jgi:hypothetical protein